LAWFHYTLYGLSTPAFNISPSELRQPIPGAFTHYLGENRKTAPMIITHQTPAFYAHHSLICGPLLGSLDSAGHLPSHLPIVLILFLARICIIPWLEITYGRTRFIQCELRLLIPWPPGENHENGPCQQLQLRPFLQAAHVSRDG